MLEQAELLEAVSAAPVVPPEVTGSRGAELRSLLEDAELGPLHRVLVEEAARIVDRLDRLDLSLSRKGEWLRFERDDGGDVVVTVDGVLAEARQQAATLKALVAEIRSALPKQEQERPGKTSAAGAGGMSGLTDFAARLAERRGAASG